MDNSIIEIAQKFGERIKAEIPFQELILFGSHSRGAAGIESDIDLAVIVDHIGDDYFELSNILYKHVREIDLRLEPILLSLENDRSGFVDSILKNGKRIVVN